MTDRLPKVGEQQRERPVLELGPLGPYKGSVAVVPVRVKSAWASVMFSVEASWTGPGLLELPPSDGPVEASDVWQVGNLELARRVAKAAADDLRQGRAPNLRELAIRFA